jgi:hypothetical protein
MEPVAGFERAVYGREREMMPDEKVRASQWTTGTLTELDEIGKSTADELIARIGTHAQ